MSQRSLLTSRARDSWVRALLLGAGLTALLTLSGPALGQSPEEIKIARQTAGEALTAYKAGEFEKALGLFDQARALYPSAQILRMTGYSHLALEHWAKTVESLEAAMNSTLGPLSEGDRKDVQDQLNKALAHFGTVHVSSRVPMADVSIDDGETQALPLDKPLRMLEGKHKFVVTAPDHFDATEEVLVEGGKLVEVALDPKKKAAPPPPPPPKPKPPPPPPKKPLIPYQRTIGIGVAGGGVALGVTALISSIAAGQIRSSVEENVGIFNKQFPKGCTGAANTQLCRIETVIVNHDADRADALRDAGVGMGIAAGVMVAGGAALFILAPREPAKPPPTQGRSLRCGPVGAGVSCAGAF